MLRAFDIMAATVQVMPPEFIVPGEQGVPFGSGFQIGPQATEANSSEQATSSFIVGTKGIVAYTAFIEEGDQMVLLEVDCKRTPTLHPPSPHIRGVRQRI